MPKWKLLNEAHQELDLPSVDHLPLVLSDLGSSKNSFFILERDGGLDYIQCAGKKSACVVEARRHKPDGTHTHAIVGRVDGDPAPAVIRVAGFEHNVERCELLKLWDAIELFSCFFQSRPLPSRYRMRAIEVEVSPHMDK